MDELIKNQSVVDIDTSPNWDKVYSGICLLLNKEILLLLNFNEETSVFDGFTILKNQDFEKYRKWEKSELKNIKTWNNKELLNSINLKNFSSLKSSLEYLKNQLIALYTYNNTEEYYVGKINSISDKSISLKPLDTQSNWLDNETINLDEISYIGFGTSYEKDLLKNVV